MDTERIFPAEATSVPAARRFVLGSLDSLSSSAFRERVGLLVSEVATNAVLYGRTPFRVNVQSDDHRVLVAVTDEGGGTPEAAPSPEPTEPHGRGLIIVRDLADDWGVTKRDSGRGKTVWFRFDLGPADAPAGKLTAGR